MMQEAADRSVTWQSQWHVKPSTANMKHPQRSWSWRKRQVEAERWRRRVEEEQDEESAGAAGPPTVPMMCLLTR